MAAPTANPVPRELTTLIKRLEAATSRLEDLADARGPPPALAAVAGSLGPVVVGSASFQPPPPPAPKLEAPKPIAAFDERILDGKLAEFMKLSDTIGGVVQTVAQEYIALLNCDRDLIVLTTYSKKPGDKPDQLQPVYKPLSEALINAQEVMSRNERDKALGQHVKALGEGLGAFQWVAMPTPVGWIEEQKQSTQFWTNRVLKDKKPIDKEWIASLGALLDELRAYVKEFYTTGLTWNAKGGDWTKFTPPPEAARAGSSAASAAPPPPPPGGIPPPPPPPPPGALDITFPPAAPAAPKPAAADPSAVFAQLNVGENVTKGLKKVTADQQTHKNPTLRAGGSVPEKAASPPAPAASGRPMKPTKPKTLAAKKPAKMELEGKKWTIEFQENESGLVIEKGEMSQVVNLFGCKNTVLQVKGKVNAISMVNCEKTSILCESVVASIGITSSKSFALQVTGSAPTILLDSVDSGQVYLSKDCLGVEIISSKCSSINVSIPEEGEEEGVFTEMAVPEQLRTVVSGKKLVTSVVEHVG